METLSKEITNDFVFKLRKVMYVGIIEELQFEYVDDEPDSEPYLYLILIKIKKKYRNQGYGAIIMEEIVQFADEHNETIILFASTLFGSELKRLYKFYRQFGFVLKRNEDDNKMVREPNKIRKNSNKLRKHCVSLYRK
jgi:GNAT superfamily N-acetyltransferase